MRPERIQKMLTEHAATLKYAMAIVGLVVPLVLAGCSAIPGFGSGGNGGNGGPTSQPNQNVKIPKSTKIADAKTRQGLSSFSPKTGTMEFKQSTDVLKSLSSGDVLVGRPASAAPSGFLRKVTSIRQSGGQIIVETEQGALTDAIERGSLDAEFTLEQSNVRSADLLPGVTPRVSSQAPGKKFSFDVGSCLYPNGGWKKCDDGNWNVKLAGNVSFGMDFNFDVNIGGFKIKNAAAWVEPSESVNVEVGAQAGVSFREEVKLADLDFGTITFAIGPVPVTLTPAVEIVAGIKGNAKIEVSFEYEQSTSYKFGVKYDNGFDGISESNQESNLTMPSESITGSAKAGPFVGLKPGLKLYSAGSVRATATLNLTFDAKVPRQPVWKLYLALDVGFELKLDAIGKIPGVKAPTVSKPKLITKKWDLKQSPNQAPQVKIQDPRDLKTDSPVEVAKRATKAFTTATADDPEGQSLNLTWSTSGGQIVGGKHAETVDVRFNQQGSSKLTLKATDPEGKTSQDTIQLNVINPVKITFKSPQASAIPRKTPMPFRARPDTEIPNVSLRNCTWRYENKEQKGCNARLEFTSASGNRVNVEVVAEDSHGNTRKTTKTFKTVAPPAYEIKGQIKDNHIDRIVGVNEAIDWPLRADVTLKKAPKGLELEYQWEVTTPNQKLSLYKSEWLSTTVQKSSGTIRLNRTSPAQYNRGCVIRVNNYEVYLELRAKEQQRSIAVPVKNVPGQITLYGCAGGG